MPNITMKTTVFIFVILCAVTALLGQGTSSSVEIVTTYSQNGKFYLKSIPFDNEFPSLRGGTFVYEQGRAEPLYVFDRGFDSVEEDSNNLILSNNGEVIFYVIPWGADEEKEGLKSITIYRHGRIFKSFTEAEITSCDKKRERCSLIYSNYDAVVDRVKSNWETKNYKKAFKEGVSEQERFLSDFPVFSFDDTVYLTDSKKQVHTFDLKTGEYTGSDSFDHMFAQIKGKGRFNKTELLSYDAPIFLDYPKLRNGQAAKQALADYIGMKPVDIAEQRDEQYKWYSFKINSNIFRDGHVEIESLDVDPALPKEKIVEFFKANKFDGSSVPQVFEMWNVGDEYFYFRKKNDQLARQEKQQEVIQQRQEFERRLTLDHINGVYIPKNLGECFTELDRLLPEVDKKEMQALPRREDMIQYHLGLGMWMRNNWGLWGGSRLQKYFTDRGVAHPDEMSSVILYHYYDWLHGQKESWRDWENNPKGNKQTRK
jgi:hypothetical protein